MSDTVRPKVQRFSRCHLESKRFRTKETTIPDPFTGQDIENPWYYFARMARGYQWDFLRRKASWASTPVKNMIQIAIESYTTMLTDNDPMMTVMPREESDEAEAEVIKAAVKHWWDDIEAMQTKIALAVKSSRTFCIGWLRTYRDDDHPHTGVKAVTAEHVWVDPDCTVDNYDPLWLIYEYKASVADLKNSYPKPVEGTWDDFDHKWKSGMSTDRVEKDRYEDNRNPAETCAVYEFWYKDDSRVKWDDEETIPGKVVKKSKKAYPGGKRQIIAGGIVLEDKKNPYDHNEIPFTPVHCYPIPNQFYGMGDAQNLISGQVMRNRMSQFIFDQTVKAGGGWLFVGVNSGVDYTKLTNAPLSFVPCRDPNALRLIAPPAPARHVFNYIDLLDADQQDVMGLHDISQGGTLPSHTTAQAVQAMTQSDRTRVRMASRWLTWAVRRVMRQVLSNWAQWPDFKWLLAISGKDEVPDSESETGASVPDIQFKEFDPKVLKSKFKSERLAYDLVIEDTSMLPTLQQDKNNQLAMWLQLQLITPEEAMKFHLVDIPQADAILAQRASNPIPPAEATMPPSGATLPPEAMQPAPQEMTAQMPNGGADMSPEEFMNAIEQMAGEQGVTPDQLVAEMMAQMNPQPTDTGVM